MRAHVLATILAALVTALAWPVYVTAALIKPRPAREEES